MEVICNSEIIESGIYHCHHIDDNDFLTHDQNEDSDSTQILIKNSPIIIEQGTIPESDRSCPIIE